ncbi:MAG: hypothetical protein KKI08_15510 [Armatimonadetes bacterium]|nr:hypothetical protein [Armatimonadota bacterium]
MHIEGTYELAGLGACASMTLADAMVVYERVEAMTGSRPQGQLPDIHTQILSRLQRQFTHHFEHMAEHIEAADLSTSKSHDTRYHLQEALEAASSLRMTLQQIAQHCCLMEAEIR